MGRTKKNIQLKIPEKPRKIKGFRLGGYPIATTISSHLECGSGKIRCVTLVSLGIANHLHSPSKTLPTQSVEKA